MIERFQKMIKAVGENKVSTVIVKDMSRLVIEGYGVTQIADILTKDKVLVSSAYAEIHYPENNHSSKKSKQEDFYNEHMAEIILFERARKYLKENLGESKTLNISKWKSEIGALKKAKDNLYSQIIDIREEVEQAESVRSCIEKLLKENRGLTQVKKQELGL